MAGDDRDSDELMKLLIMSNLKIASVVSSLLFVCRLAIPRNEQAEKEMDAASEKIDQYLDIVEKLVRKADEKGHNL